MKNLRTLSVMMLGAMFILASCGKYEEGPALSFKSKTSRLAGDWQIAKYVYPDGSEEVPSEDEKNAFTLTFEKDGKVISNYSSGSITIKNEGTWEFTNSKEDLKTTFGNETETVTILKLSSDELWTKDSDGDITHMEAK